MKGRKPKPTALRLIEGNREHRTIHAELEPKPASTAPPKPRFLNAAARRHWNYLIKHLRMMGTLGASDQGVIMAASITFGEIDEEMTFLKEQRALPLEQRDIKGELAMARRFNNSLRDLVRFEAELGLNPTARTRIKLDKPREQSRRSKLLA